MALTSAQRSTVRYSLGTLPIAALVLAATLALAPAAAAAAQDSLVASAAAPRASAADPLANSVALGCFRGVPVEATLLAHPRPAS